MARRVSLTRFHIDKERMMLLHKHTTRGFAKDPVETLLKVRDVIASKFFSGALSRSGVSMAEFKDDLWNHALNIFQKYDPDRPGAASFNTFANSSFRNTALNLLKSRRYRSRVVLSESEMEFLMHQSSKQKRFKLDSEEVRVIRNAVASLPEKQREVVELYYGFSSTDIRGISHAKIGRQLGFSDTESWRIWKRALKSLRTGKYKGELEEIWFSNL